MFVVGGSYKGFYLNQVKNIKKIDLLIFHQNIFYDFDYIQEKYFDAPVSKELISLNIKLKCPIIVYGNFIKNNIKQHCYILCSNKKVSVINEYKDLYLYIKGKFILIGNKIYRKSKAFATISLINDKQNYENYLSFKPQNYFICDKKGVSHLENGKIYRKFRKCCYFTLKKK